MTQYKTLNVKLCSRQRKNLKPWMKHNNEVISKLSSYVIDDSTGGNNFLHKLLLTNTQASELCKCFANGSKSNIKLAKTQLHKIGQSGQFFGRLLGPLLKTG